MRLGILFIIVGGLTGGLLNTVHAADLTIQAQVAEMSVRIRGLAVLAEYPKPGPKVLHFRRDRGDDTDSLSVVRVLDPTGHCCAVEVLDRNQRDLKLVIPPGPAGIYRFSYSGGAAETMATFIIPKTENWGIRGEPGLAAITPAAEWLWLPPGGGRLIVRRNSGAKVDIRNEQGAALAETAVKQPNTGAIALPQAGGLWQVTGTGPFALDGMPILLCPTAKAATALQAGAIKIGDTWLYGPLQARAQAWMNAAVRDNLTLPHVDMPNPIAVADPLPLVQLFGKYAPLPGMFKSIDNQVMDPESADFGLLVPIDKRIGRGDWRQGTRSGVTSAFDVAGLAALVSADLPGNPYFRNPILVRRAGLIACGHLRTLDGGDLIRERTLAEELAPVVHAFFVYSSLAKAFELLQDQCDPELRAIWRDGLLAVSDRLADHRVYETNQWWHILNAHHGVAVATGENRILEYFRNGMEENLRGKGGVKSLGQLPNGFFSENGGMDGNYDHLSTTCVVACWRRAVVAGQSDIAKALLDALQRNAEVASLFWLPQPDGSTVSPTLFNCRTNHPLGAPGWPGLILARDALPLAATRWRLLRRPEQGLDLGMVFPHLINEDPWWARKAMQGSMQLTATSSAIEAPWTSEAIACALEKPLASAPLPCRTENFIRELPGIFAIRLGEFYVLQVGKTGEPAAIWSESLGAIVLAPRPPSGKPNKQESIWNAALDGQALVLTRKGAGGLTLPLYWQSSETEWQGAHGSGIFSVKPAQVRLSWGGSTRAILDPGIRLDGQTTRLLHIPAQADSDISIRFELNRK